MQANIKNNSIKEVITAAYANFIRAFNVRLKANRRFKCGCCFFTVVWMQKSSKCNNKKHKIAIAICAVEIKKITELLRQKIGSLAIILQ